MRTVQNITVLLSRKPVLEHDRFKTLKFCKQEQSHVPKFLCTYVCVYIYIYTCIYIYVCMCVCMYVCVYIYACMCVYMYVYMYVCVCMYLHMYIGVHNMFCAYLPPPFQQNRFTICSQFFCRIVSPPRLVILYRFSSFNSCSSPSSFPSFHNFFSDLLSTILPGIDKGVVQSQLALGRKGNIFLDNTQSVFSYIIAYI
jgi:hypothetical protein